MEQPNSIKKDVNVINNKKPLNSELLFFKNEILGDLKQLENKLLRKLEQKTDGTQKKIVQIEASVDALTKKFFSMSSFYSENITMKDKIDNLFQNISKLEGAMFTHDFRISSLEKDLVTAINKYDKIIEKSIYYPGLIGANNAKFNTFHNFIDFVMQNISQLNIFKDKTMGIDLKQYKNKLESTIEGFKKQTDEIITNNKIYTSKLIKNLDNKFKNDFELFDQRLFNLKIKNTEQVMGIEKLSKNVINEASTLKDMKNNIEKTYQASIQILRWHYVYAENRINQCVKDYDEIKKGLDLIIEALKGLKGGSIPNLPEILREYGNLGDNKSESNKKNKVESLLKKYIVGEMNMEQISQLSKKSSSSKIIFHDVKSNINNIFKDNINSDSNSNKKSNLRRVNTRSFVKFENNNKLSFSRDSQKSESKSNKINIFNSQKIVFPKRIEIQKHLSSSINFKTNKNNNSDIFDNNINNKLENTFYNENKYSKINEQKINISPKSEFKDLRKNNKNLFDEKLSLSSEIHQNSSLWIKGQKNNNFNIKQVSIIKESESEYKNDLLKQEKEVKESIKKIKLSEESLNKLNKSKENENKKINSNENLKSEKNKNSTELKKSNEEEKVEETSKKDEALSNLEQQTILSTITEHDVITPKGEEEKEIPKEIKSVEIKEGKNKEEKKFNEKIEKIKEKEKIYEDKENNADLHLPKEDIKEIKEFNSMKQETTTNIKNIKLPFDNAFPETNKDNNFYLEIENKTTNKNAPENKNNNIIINNESKIGLQKLFKGDRNALNSFKLIRNGEDIKIPKIPSSENERKRKLTDNITSTRSRTKKDIKSASSLNFFKNSNSKLNNLLKFDIIENLFENNLDNFYNDLSENTDINNYNPLLQTNQQNNVNKNAKLNIINIPGIPQSPRNVKNQYSKEAFNRIEALRKIKNENNKNINIRKRNNKSDEYIRNLRQFGKIPMNNRLMRTYEGFNM